MQGGYPDKMPDRSLLRRVASAPDLAAVLLERMRQTYEDRGPTCAIERAGVGESGPVPGAAWCCTRNGSTRRNMSDLVRRQCYIRVASPRRGLKTAGARRLRRVPAARVGQVADTKEQR